MFLGESLVVVVVVVILQAREKNNKLKFARLLLFCLGPQGTLTRFNKDGSTSSHLETKQIWWNFLFFFF